MNRGWKRSGCDNIRGEVRGNGGNGSFRCRETGFVKGTRDRFLLQRNGSGSDGGVVGYVGR